MPFKVSKVEGVGAKMRALATLASLAGLRQSYMAALLKMYEKLAIDPLGWGDPIFRQPHKGGIICHALVGPIVVHYSVHEPENTVFIMDVKPLFEWPPM